MRRFLLAIPLLAGCVVVHEVHEEPYVEPAPSPGYATAVSTHYYPVWTDVRYCIWREYYYCTPAEVYYLESCGYDDRDLLFLLMISRYCTVPIRYVVYEYQRCGYSLYGVTLVYGVPYTYYYTPLPAGTWCPGPYATVYGYYWSGTPYYLTNAECHALIDLQIGVGYYGYSHTGYFQAYDRARSKGHPHPFRSMAVGNYKNAGAGGNNAIGKPLVRRLRPWEARSRNAWEAHLKKERATAGTSPDRQREEHQRMLREQNRPERVQASVDARRKLDQMRSQREVETRRRELDPPAAAGPSRLSPPKGATGREATPPPTPRGVGRPGTTPSPSPRRVEPGRPPASPGRGQSAPRATTPSAPPPRSTQRRAPAPAPPSNRGRSTERRTPPPAPSNRGGSTERRTPPPAPPPRRVERRTPPSPPPPSNRGRSTERRTPPPPPPRSPQNRTPPRGNRGGN